MNKNILYLFLLILFSACHDESELKHVIKQELIDSIQCYIDKDSCNHPTYLILYAEGLLHNGNVHNGVLMGPMYRNMHSLYKESEYMKIIEYNKKTVYFYSPFAQFMEMPNRNDVKIDYCDLDSVLYYKNEYSHSPIINYLKRAYLLYYKDEKLYIKEDIDSLFLPRIE